MTTSKAYRLIIILCLTFLQNLSMQASTYYVSNSGNDSNDGLTLAMAFLTIQHAVDLVMAGDTVFVENGTYAGFDIRNVSGTSTEPIVFMALGADVILNQPGPIRDDIINVENADHVVIDGFTTRDSPFAGNGIRVVVSDHCVVRNNFCDNNGQRGIFTGFTDDILIEHNICSNSNDEHGIYVSNSSDRPIVRFNECYGNNAIGIHMNGDLSAGGDGIISDAQIYGNILHDNNLAAGINLDGVERAVVYNNLIYNNHFAQGIAMFQGDGAIVSSGAKIYNNTIIVPDDGRWGILLKQGAGVDTEIYNNIILTEHAWRGCIAAEGVTGLSSDYNIVNDRMSTGGDGSTSPLSDWQMNSLDVNSQIADAQNLIFEGVDIGDYHLLPTSQAIDAGTSAVSPVVMVDLDGNVRPSGVGFDIGAYEGADTTSTANHELRQMGIVLSPNPAREHFTVYGHSANYDISILAPNGQCLRQFSNISLPYTVYSSSFSNGIYLISITNNTNGQFGVGKFIKVD